MRGDAREEPFGNGALGASGGTRQLIGRVACEGSEAIRDGHVFRLLRALVVSDDPRRVVCLNLLRRTARPNDGRVIGHRVPRAIVFSGIFGVAWNLIADAQDELGRLFVHPQLDRFEVTASPGGFVDHGAPNREERKRLLDRQRGCRLRLELRDDGRIDSVQLKAHRRRFGGGTAPALDERFDSHLIAFRQMREADTELPCVLAALVRPHHAADHLDRFAAGRIVELAPERRSNLRQDRSAHGEAASAHVDGVGFELLVEALGVQLDQHLIERHARWPRCLVVSRGSVHRMLSGATREPRQLDWSQN